MPLVRYADWGVTISLMLYQLCDLGGAAAMLKVSRRVGTIRSTHTHTLASSGEARRLVPSSDSAAMHVPPLLHTDPSSTYTTSTLTFNLFVPTH